MVRHGAAYENSCSNADVPSRKVGAVCRAALVVAGEIHAHGLVAGEDKSEACSDKECRQEERNGPVAKGEDKVGDDDQRHAGTHQMDQVTAVNQAACHDAVQDEACGDESIEPARAANAKFIGVNGDVVCDRAVSKSDEDEVCKLRNGAREEKSVKRKRSADLLFTGLHLERLHEHKSNHAKDCRNGKNDPVAECFVKKHSGHGTGGEGQVHADPEIPDAFASATCGQCIDGHCITCGTRNAKE